MKTFIRKTVTGGIIFLIPIIILVIIFEKAFVISRKIIAPVQKLFPAMAAENRILLEQLIAVLFIIIICFVAGLCAKTKWGQHAIKVVENALLSKIPGYTFIKSTGEQMLAAEKSGAKNVVIVMFDDAWQIGFLIEECPDDKVTVFVPDAPSPWTGSVFLIEKVRIKYTSVSFNEALSIMKQMGKGSTKLFTG